VVGMSVGYLVTVSPATVGLIAVTGILATIWVRSRNPVLPWLALLPIILASVAVPGIKVPLADFGVAVAWLASLSVEDDEPTRVPTYLTVTLGAIVFVASASIITVNAPISGAISRILHLTLFGMLLWALAAGKITQRNLTRAIVVGLASSSVLGVVSLIAGGGSNYSNRLTGLFGDPNVAALITVALGMVALSNLEVRRHRQLLILLMTVTVALSFSRTGLLALAVALAWAYSIHKAPTSVAVLSIIVVVVASFTLPSQIQTIGPYASHASSDQFRAVIDQASFLDMRTHFVLGSGAGTAVVQIPNGTTFFFHNSFEALVTEFGIPGSVLYLVLALSTVGALFGAPRRYPMVEAAFLALLVMSLTVGEVLFAFTGAVVMGTAWRLVLLERRRVGSGGSREVPSRPRITS
jgi:hypothetical protein